MKIYKYFECRKDGNIGQLENNTAKAHNAGPTWRHCFAWLV